MHCMNISDLLADVVQSPALPLQCVELYKAQVDCGNTRMSCCQQSQSCLVDLQHRHECPGFTI